MKYGKTESFILIFMLIFGAVTKSYITRMFKSNSGEPYAGKLHVRFLEEFISNGLITREGENLLMQTGWSGPGRQYYFDDAGKMLEQQFTPDGYYVGSGEAYVRNGWALNDGKYYYMNSGKVVKCSWVGSYYLGSDGVMVTNKWKGSYYLGSNGAMVTNCWIGNYWCGEGGTAFPQKARRTYQRKS